MLKVLFLVLSLLPCCLMAEALRVESDGSVAAEELRFRMHWHGKGWKTMALQGPETVSFPGEAGQAVPGKGNVRTGSFRVEGGSFRFTQAVDRIAPERLKLHFELDSDPPIDTEALYLGVSLPVERFLDRPVIANGRDLRFGKTYDPERRRAWGGKTKEGVTIPLDRGVLTLRGAFSVMLQDDRGYKKDNWGLRIFFGPANNGPIQRAELVVEFEYAPYPAAALDLRGAMNLAFKDEKADDRRGGWTDQGRDNDLGMLPLGKRSFGDLEFDIVDPAANEGNSVVILRGEARPWLPQEAAVPVGKVPARKYLYLLNALGWEPARPTEIGEVTLVYADGSESRHPVKSGVDTANFWKPHYLEKGIPVWEGENPSSKVGLYASRIDLQPKPLREIRFRSAGNAVWMIAAATVTDALVLPGKPGPLVMEANEEWRPIGNPKPVVPGSVVDFSDLIDHRPAGKFGPVRVAGDRLEFAGKPGVPARFWGINLAGSCCFPTAEQTAKLVDELARMGYNLVRLHHFDHDLARFDPDTLDRFDRLAARCKERGIYLTLDLLMRRSLEKGELSSYPDRAFSTTEFKALIFIDDEAMKNFVAFGKTLLGHVNPYTGVAWKEEPALISVSLINEGTLSRRSVATLFVKELYEKEFQRHLAAKSLTVTEANRPALYAEFLQEVYRRGYRKLADSFREFGLRAPLTDLNYINDVSTTLLRDEHDLVDNHGYWAHPQFLGSNWRLPASTEPSSAIEAYGGIGGALFQSRIFGKPFTLTEWDYTFPNPYLVEGPFLLGAYASLQGHSALCRFTYAWTIDKIDQAESHLCFFDMANAPLRLLSERAGALFYLRGDVAEAKESFPIWFDRDFLARPEHPRWCPSVYGRLGLIGKTGVVFDAERLPLHSRALLYAAKPGKEPAGLPSLLCGGAEETLRLLTKRGVLTPRDYDPAEERFTSSTGELELNRRRLSFQAVTPKSEGFVGKEGNAFEGKFARVRMTSGFSAVLVASRDGRPLPESRRLLILHLTECRNTGTRFSAPDGVILEKYGIPPLLMRRGEVEITLPVLPGARLYACDFDGSRRFEIPVTSPVFTLRANNITPQGPVAVYELICE